MGERCGQVVNGIFPFSASASVQQTSFGPVFAAIPFHTIRVSYKLQLANLEIWKYCDQLILGIELDLLWAELAMPIHGLQLVLPLP